MSQLVGSQLNPMRALGKERELAQSSANRNGEDPEAKGSEQVAESRAWLGASILEKSKPNAEEELQALLGETGSPFLDHIMMA